KKSVKEGRVMTTATYRWDGLLKNHGVLNVTYDTEEKFITGFYTADAPSPPDPFAARTAAAEETAADPMAPVEASASSPGGGGRNFDPMSFDLDQDGKISLEESPPFWKESLSEIDKNGDGFADAEEIENRPRRRRGGRD